MRAMLRLHAYGLSAVLFAAAGHPLWLDPLEGDDFPASTYPMFADDVGRTTSVVRAVAVDRDGGETTIPAGLIANQEPMQALETIRKAAGAGPREARALCSAIAGRLHEAADPTFAKAVRIELQTVQVDSVRFLGGDERPLSRRVHARCPAGG